MVKTSVLKDEFTDSVKSLIDQIKRQKDIIIKSYGPLMLQPKREETGIYEIPRELDPAGHKWLKDLNKA